MVAQRLDLGHGGLDVAPTVVGPVTVATTARLGDLVLVDSSGGVVTVTLPSADIIGVVSVKLTAGASVTVARGVSTDTIDGAASTALATIGGIITLVSTGVGTWITSGVSIPVPSTEAVNTVAVSGAAQTIPEPAQYGLNDITLTAGCTLTFPADSKGKTLRMVIRQNAVGNFAVTWPAGSIFPGGTDVVISVAANAIDYVEAFCVVEDVWMITRIGAAYAV
jgi:hypothetical protein